MTDIRQALEKAFVTIFGPEPDSEYDGRAWKRNEPDFSPTWTAYINKRTRFHRFLDAEAWTDAAMMLVPEGCGVDMLTGSNELPQFIAHSAMPTMARVFFLSKGIDVSEVAETPAHALLAACLKAKEQADA